MTKTYLMSLLLAVLTTILLTTSPSCANMAPSTKAQLITAATCAGADLLPQVKQLVSKIEAGDLTAIATAGSDILQCALPFLSGAVGGGGVAPPGTSAVSSKDVRRAEGAAEARRELERRGVKVGS